MPKAIHYKHQQLGYHACGMGKDQPVEMTDDVSKVTCKRCLGTVTGKNAAGRPTNGDRAKVRINTRIDPGLKEWAIAHNLSFSDLLENAIKAQQNL